MNMQNTTSVRTAYVAATIDNIARPAENPDAHKIINLRDTVAYKTNIAAPQPEQNQQQSPAAPTNTVKKELKIVVTGNVGSGKSTSIRSISEVPVISTEAKATERDALHRKETTTTSMEYGMVHLANTKLHIYGTPGQRRFDFVADILCKGAHGMIVMIDNGCREPMTEIDYYLNQHGNFLQKYPGIIAITHFEDNNTRTSLVDYHAYIRQNGFTCPVMLLDARNRHDMQKVLMKLLVEISNAKIGKKQLF